MYLCYRNCLPAQNFSKYTVRRRAAVTGAAVRKLAKSVNTAAGGELKLSMAVLIDYTALFNISSLLDSQSSSPAFAALRHVRSFHNIFTSFVNLSRMMKNTHYKNNCQKLRKRMCFFMKTIVLPVHS